MDQRQQWFRLDLLPQYGLPNIIEKVLSVAERVEVSKLRAAIVRHRRSNRGLPPVKILLEFCRQMPDVRIEGNTIISDPPRDWRKTLTGVERLIVEVLSKHGPVMERMAFEERCVRAGMNRFSFNVIIMSSPVVEQYGRSVYGLLGLKVDRKAAQKLVSQRPAITPARVLRAFGQTDNGRFYLAYRLSKAAISGGVITMPAAMKRHIHGRFTLRTPDGRKVGTLVVKKGCGWGLGPVLRGTPAEPGDYMLLLFDKASHSAQIRIGDENIMQEISGA